MYGGQDAVKAACVPVATATQQSAGTESPQYVHHEMGDHALQPTYKQSSVEHLSHPHGRVQDSSFREHVYEEQKRRDGVDACQQHCQDGKLIKVTSIQQLQTTGATTSRQHDGTVSKL
jgi:hypothetical protein